MRKNVFGRRLKRDSNERKALFKGLLSSLVLYDRIKTTEAKAKSIKGLADRIVSYAKKDSSHARSLLPLYLTPAAIKKCIDYIAPAFLQRSSGYTRIIRLGKRMTDHAPMVLMEWVDIKVKSDKEVGEPKQENKMLVSGEKQKNKEDAEKLSPSKARVNKSKEKK